MYGWRTNEKENSDSLSRTWFNFTTGFVELLISFGISNAWLCAMCNGQSWEGFLNLSRVVLSCFPDASNKINFKVEDPD